MRGRGGEGLAAPGPPRNPVTRTLAAGLLLAAFAVADEVEDAGRLFKAQCASCHAIPDRDLPHDRAWLGQLPKTA